MGYSLGTLSFFPLSTANPCQLELQKFAKSSRIEFDLIEPLDIMECTTEEFIMLEVLMEMWNGSIG